MYPALQKKNAELKVHIPEKKPLSKSKYSINAPTSCTLSPKKVRWEQRQNIKWNFSAGWMFCKYNTPHFASFQFSLKCKGKELSQSKYELG